MSFVFFVGTWFLSSQDCSFPWFKVTIKIAAVSIIFGLSVWTLRPWSFPIPLVVGAVGYLLSLTIIKFWEDEELYLFRQRVLGKLYRSSVPGN